MEMHRETTMDILASVPDDGSIPFDFAERLTAAFTANVREAVTEALDKGEPISFRDEMTGNPVTVRGHAEMDAYHARIATWKAEQVQPK